MSESENKYLEDYKEIISEYQRSFPAGLELDLNKDLEPPHDIFI
jgi:hypothetical protein